LTCIKSDISECICICTHGYEGHNPWHTVNYIKLITFKQKALNFVNVKNIALKHQLVIHLLHYLELNPIEKFGHTKNVFNLYFLIFNFHKAVV